MCSTSRSFYESDDDDESLYFHQISVHEKYRRFESVCVKFVNKTGRYIYVSGWDEGEMNFPNTVRPGKSFEVTTFVTCPWKFYDAFTNERYVVNNQKCFLPYTGSKFTKQFNITPGVRTLRRIALVTLGTYIKKEDDVDTLRLPPALIGEVKSAVKYMNDKWLWQVEGEDYVDNKSRFWSKCDAVVWKLLYLTAALLLVDLFSTYVLT